MPSPVGHALGAMAVGWLATGTAGPSADRVRRSLWLAGIGLVPDLDLLIGRHSAETHSVGAAFIAASIAAAMRWPLAATRVRIFAAVLLAWLSHPILDWLGSDTSLPLGVMILWPLSSAHYLSDAEVFLPITRRWWLAGFVTHTLAAVGRELVVLGPLVVLSWVAMRRTPRYRS